MINIKYYRHVNDYKSAKRRNKDMVKLKDIAQACGVSVATVSRALNGLTDPTNGKTEAIRQIAQEMGYYPNAAAKALKTNRSNNIGILYEDQMNHEYFSTLIDALRTNAEARGYDLTFIGRGEGDSGNYYEHARRRNLDGVVVIQADFNSAEVIRLATSNMPTVVIDHEYEGCDCVLSDNGKSMEQIIASVHAEGHSRIAFIHGEDGTVTRNRIAGFYKGCAELGLKVPAEYMRKGKFHDPAGCAQTAVELMALPEPPTCILFPDDYSSLGALVLLEGRGIKIPGDVSVVGYDGIRLTQMMRPRLTTYSQDTAGIGKETIQLLIEAIESPETHKARHISVSGVMMPGETLGKI